MSYTILNKLSFHPTLQSWFKDQFEKDLENIFKSFKNWLRMPAKIRSRKKIEIEFIDDEIAIESNFAEIFYSVGFEKEGASIVLWPSGL